jgi:hypothetical protein
MIKLKSLLFENFSKQLSDIEKYVTRNSSFEVSDNNKYSILFTTRKHGSVYDERPGAADYREGIKLKKELERKYKGIKVQVDTTDEWTNLHVNFDESDRQKSIANRIETKEYKNLIPKIEKYVEAHIISKLPYLSTEDALGKKLSKRDYINTIDTKSDTKYHGSEIWSNVFTHTVKIGWIDTDIPIPNRKREFDKYVKELKRDIYTKFKFSKFTKDKDNTSFDVKYIGGEGIWMHIIITSPLLKKD